MQPLRPKGELPSAAVSQAGDGADGLTTSERSLEDRIGIVMADDSMPPSQKRQELEDLLGQAREGGGDMEAYAPVEHRLLEALGLLADGGHDYGQPPAVDDGAAEKG